MGCPKCEKLAEHTQTALTELGVAFELEKVTDINDILSFGIMMTPGLAIDGKVLITGKVPSIDEIKTLVPPQQEK